MADRVIRTRFIADVEGYRQAVRNAAKSTADFGRDVSSTLSSTSAKTQQSLDRMGKASLIAGGALLAGFGLAEKAVIGFDKQLSEVAAVSGATSDELGQLRRAAIDAGQATVFSASDAAKAEAELAKAGVSTADILGGGLRGALDLASAGNLELGQAATFAANAMTTFGLSGKDVGRIADALAAGANKSAANVDEIGQSLQQTGIVASQLGLTMEETVGILSLFAQAGLKGSDAGTSLKTALQRLTPQSAEAAALMKQLGIVVFDSAGKFVGIDKAAQSLQDGLGKLNQQQRQQALTTIFGSDAIRAATLLYQAGAKGVQDWTNKVSDSGYAARVAATRMDNLAGDIEQLQGSIETALIEGGSQATGVLRFLTQQATDTVNGFVEMPPVLQSVAVGFSAVAGGGLVLLGAVGTLAPKLERARESLNNMGRAGQLLSRNLATIGGAVAIAGVAFAAVAEWESILAGARDEGARWSADTVQNFDAAKASYSELGDAIRTLQGNIEEAERRKSKLTPIIDDDQLPKLNAFIDAQGSLKAQYFELRDKAVAYARALNISYDEALKLVQGHKDLGAASSGVVSVMDREAAATKLVTDRMQEQSDKIKGILNPWFAVESAAGRLADAQQRVADATEAATVGLSRRRQELEDAVARAQENLADAQARLSAATTPEEQASAARSLADAQRQLDRAQQDLADSAKDAEQAQRDLERAQRDAVGAARDVDSALSDLAVAVNAGSTSMDDARATLQRWVDAGLITQAQADAWIANVQTAAATVNARIDEIKAQSPVTVEIGADNAPALAAISDVQQALNQLLLPPGVPLPAGVPPPVVAQPGVGGAIPLPPGVTAHAEGGVYSSRHVGVLAEAGPEAYIARYGSRDRQLGTLSAAAGWFGMDVVPERDSYGTFSTATAGAGVSAGEIKQMLAMVNRGSTQNNDIHIVTGDLATKQAVDLALREAAWRHAVAR